MTAQRSDTIWTKTFILLCAAQLLGYAQHFMLAPVLPLYVTQLGGSPLVVGAVLSCFAVTSVIVRPLVGHWVDRWSEAGVMISGMCFQAVSVFFCFVPFIPFTALANSLRGIGWGGLNTGGYSLLARIAPESRRGAASGLYSGVQSSAQIFFPPIALWLLYASFGGYRAVFIVTAIFCIAGAVTGLILAPLVARPAPAPTLEEETPWWRAIFHFIEPEILLPSILLLWLNVSLPAITNFIILYAKELGIEHFSPYFIVIGATSMLGRPLLGRLSDRIGRVHSIASGFILQVAGLLFFIFVSESGRRHRLRRALHARQRHRQLHHLGARRRARRSAAARQADGDLFRRLSAELRPGLHAHRKRGGSRRLRGHVSHLDRAPGAGLDLCFYQRGQAQSAGELVHACQ